MKVARITSDRFRQKFLNDASRYLKRCIEDGKEPPFTFLVERLNALTIEFATACDAWQDKYRLWRDKTDLRLALNEDLSRCVRDFYQVLSRRTARLKQGDKILQYYKGPTDGNWPNVVQITAWELLAQKVITGEAKAVADGYPAMSNPDVAEIQMHLDKVADADLSVKTAQSARSVAQQKAKVLREEVDEMHRRIYYLLTGWLANLEPGTRRDEMRNFGYEFESGSTSDTEIPEPETRPQEPEPAPEPETVTLEEQNLKDPEEQTPPDAFRKAS